MTTAPALTSLRTQPSSQPLPPAGSTTLLQARGVRKSFAAGRSRVEILHGIDLHLAPGEVCAVMGPSGSGKSTLLSCLAGLERPTSGEVQLLGTDLEQLSRADLARARRTDVGFVFQSYNLVPALTGRENVALTFRLRRERPPWDRIDAVLAQLAISHLADQRPASMSGGEQQRVAIARVLAQEPRVVFADEPTGALDSASSAVVLEMLVDLAHSSGRGVLLVTHDPAVAAACDRVVVLRDGLVVTKVTGPTVDRVTEVLAELGRPEQVA